ncbi:MAG TPA: ABC transporter ATP-binding protein, partial [Myxococcaceae bacterium]|nr:ABC transporter ATP-binding protein [Myxococcaceae bacterium]
MPVLRRLLGYGRPHWPDAARAVACMLALGVTTGLYAYLMGPALRFVLSGGAEGLGFLGALLPALARADRARALWFFPAVILAIGVVKGVAYLGQFYWMGLFGQRVAMGVRRDLFAKLASLSPVQQSRELTGDLLSRFSADVAAVELAATYTTASYFRDGLQIVILLGVAIALDWRVALGTLAIVPIAAVPVSRFTRAFMRRTREGQAKLGELAGQIQEGLGGLKTIQAFNGQSAEMSRFGGHAELHRKAMTHAGWARAAVPSLMEVLAAIAIATALGLATWSRAIPPEKLVSLLAAVVLVYQPAKDLGRVGQFALQAAAAGERIFYVLDQQPLVGDAPGATALGKPRQGIRLEAVHFSYGARAALNGVDLDIPAGQVTALVGPSGSGKSTLASLLLRFARPDRGQIRVDGCDVERATAQSVRAEFALVTQESLLFSETVADNIAFGRPRASPEQIEEAARVAQADGFIRALPHGYQTRVGERGVVLSGGQKQRICLARALLADAPV